MRNIQSLIIIGTLIYTRSLQMCERLTFDISWGFEVESSVADVVFECK